MGGIPGDHSIPSNGFCDVLGSLIALKPNGKASIWNSELTGRRIPNLRNLLPLVGWTVASAEGEQVNLEGGSPPAQHGSGKSEPPGIQPFSPSPDMPFFLKGSLTRSLADTQSSLVSKKQASDHTENPSTALIWSVTA